MRKILIFLAFTVLLFGWPFLAFGAGPSFVWRGDKGYRVEIYLPTPGENSSENPENFVFTDPHGKRLAQYPKSLTNPYFQLHLSRENRHLAGDLDVGGEKPGEYFLKGRVGGTLELVQVLAPGREVVVDRGREWEE